MANDVTGGYFDLDEVSESPTEGVVESAHWFDALGYCDTGTNLNISQPVTV